MRLKRCAFGAFIALALVLSSLPGLAADGRFAYRVVSSSGFGGGLYGTPEAVLGKPTTWILAMPGSTFACSMVYGAFNTAPDGSSVVTTIGPTAYIVVEFDQPIYDDPANWDHKDFIVFGNAAFQADRSITPTTNMEVCKVSNGMLVSGIDESVTVAVSQDAVNWYVYPSPQSDSYWPTNAFAWNRDTHTWGDELDPTKPVFKDLTSGDFAQQYVADAIDIYKGSAGGTAYDLTPSGFAWIRYVKLTGNDGEVDAIARASHPLSIAEAKTKENGMPVSLGVNVVSAGNDPVDNPDFADCFYIQSLDRTCGIKVTGKTAASGARVMLSGVMSTVNGERVIRATWLETQP